MPIPRIFNSVREETDILLPALKLMLTSQVPSDFLMGFVTEIEALGKFVTW